MIPTLPEPAPLCPSGMDPTGRSDRPADAPEAALGRLLDRGWDRLLSARPVVVIAAVTALVLARSGISLSRMDLSYVLAAADAYPQALPDWRTNSPLGPWIAGALGVRTEVSWFVLCGVLVVLAAVVAGVCVGERVRSRAGRTVAGTWLALASFPTAVLQRVGWYDVFTVTGAFLVVGARRRSLALFGGALIGLTNAEQGVVGLTTAALVAIALRPDEVGIAQAVRDLRREPLGERLVLGLAGVVVARLSLLLLFAVQDVAVEGRSDMFGRLLGRSVVNSLGAGGAGVFAWLGLAWGAVALTWFVRRWAWRRWIGLVASLLVGPALATVTTLDGSRVFAMVSLPGLLVLVTWLAERVEDPEALGARLVRRVTVVALAGALVVPALITEPTGEVWFSFPWSA